MDFQREDIIHLAQLARIELSEHDIEKFREQLTSVLAYVDQVAGVDIPETVAHAEATAFRADVVQTREGSPEELMKAVPRTEEGHIAALSVK